MKFWTKENTVIDLGRFPSANELNKMGENGLMIQMTRKGGFNYFRKLAGVSILQEKSKAN